MIQAYPAHASVPRGGTLMLHVSTGRRRFRMHSLRWTGRLEPLAATAWLPGEHAPLRDAGSTDWPQAVVSGDGGPVAAITRNVMSHLLEGTA
ncbi:hypothetical protein [Massilia sp. METH4]|uniref:hypothetical protein n=1 Tax=Massilia sp. METH4 TaxID=3123041 RepID=UPI0030D02A2F